MPSAYVFSAPWAHFHPDDQTTGIGRRVLEAETVVRVPVGTPVHLAVAAEATVQLSGYRTGAQPIGLPYYLGASCYRLYVLSVGTRSDENRIEIEIDGQPAGVVEICGFFPRPAWSAGREGGQPLSLAGESLDNLLLSIIDLIRLVDDPQYHHLQVFWDRLTAAWSDEDVQGGIPPLDLIVRHAETLRQFIADLAERPRHILRRTRDLTRVDRVQQLDVTCLRWLSRQPGRTIYESAGPRQRILAVQRYESADTLENRVLRDFTRRSNRVALAYTRRYLTLRRHERWKKVDLYARECHRWSRSSAVAGISLPQPPVVPNYVLMHEPRYRKLWRAYLEILRLLDEEDECWRWQHRLWTDFCRLLLQVALRRDDNFGRVAESPLRIAGEQSRGVWSLVDAQSAVFTANTPRNGEVVVSTIWDPSADHPKLEPWMSGLGPGSILYIQSLNHSREAFVLIWPLHQFSPDAPSLVDVVASANSALTRCLSNLQLTENVEIHASGLVLMSNSNPEAVSAGPNLVAKRRVRGCRFGISRRDRMRALSQLPKLVLTLIDDALGGESADER